MRYLTQEERVAMPVLDRLKHEVRENLTREHNNQIRGFYDWNGYWTRKKEAINGGRCVYRVSEEHKERMEHLPEIFDYMSSITPEDIARWTREEGKEHLRRWPYAGRGRYSHSTKTAMRQSTAGPKSHEVLNNYSILRRVRWHIGAVLDRLTLEEVQAHVDEIAAHELNSTFWGSEVSRSSNAMFRLELCHSWLEGTKHEQVILDKLSEVAEQRLRLFGLTPDTGLDAQYREKIEAAGRKIVGVENEIAEHKATIEALELVTAGYRQEIRDEDVDVGGIRLTEYSKLSKYVKGGSDNGG